MLGAILSSPSDFQPDYLLLPRSNKSVPGGGEIVSVLVYLYNDIFVLRSYRSCVKPYSVRYVIIRHTSASVARLLWTHIVICFKRTTLVKIYQYVHSLIFIWYDWIKKLHLHYFVWFSSRFKLYHATLINKGYGTYIIL